MDSDNLSSQDEEEDWDFEDEDADAEDSARSLFEELTLPSIGAALRHDRDVHGFDFRSFRTQACIIPGLQ